MPTSSKPQPSGRTGPVDPGSGDLKVLPQPFEGVLRVRRPFDGLVVDIWLVRVLRFLGGGPITGRPDGSSRVVLRLPGQSIGELAQREDHPVQQPMQAALASTANVVFSLPAGQLVPLSVGELLAACSRLPLLPGSFGPVTGGGDVDLKPFEPTQMQIEAPFLLHLTPEPGTAFVNAAPTVTNQRVPLWHTRLVPVNIAGAPSRGQTADPVGVIAIGQRHPPLFSKEKFFTALDRHQRGNLARHTRGYQVPPDQTSPPPVLIPARPARSRNLLLTPLGATLDIEGQWETTTANSLRGWWHRATAGRDTYVKVVEDGYLAPFGHRASRVTVTERSVDIDDGQNAIARLWSRSWVVVSEPVRRYPGLDTAAGRRFPFLDVELLNLVTPHQPPEASWILAGPDSKKPFDFDVVAHDAIGTKLRFRMPLFFVLKDDLHLIGETYDASASEDRRQADLAGAGVQLAEADTGPDGPGTTNLHVHQVTFSVALPLDLGEHPVRPIVSKLDVAVPGGEEFTGSQRTGTFTINETYADAKTGFGAQNQAELFLQTDDPVQLFAPGSGARTESAGGLATPSLQVGGITRKAGAIAGHAADVVGGMLDPVTQLGDIKLLGVISLSDLVSDKKTTLPLGELPKLTREVGSDGQVSASMSLVRTSQDGCGVGVFTVEPAHDGVITFSLTSTVVTAPGGKPQGASVRADLTNTALAFSLGDLGDIRLVIDRLAMAVDPGQKPDLTLEFASPPLQFTKALGYIQKLFDVIPASAFTDPPDINITSSGLDASYSLALPPLPLGAFNLSNVSLNAGFSLPFIGGRPSLLLDFAARDRPFSILVAILGGGGYFGVQLGTAGIIAIEGSLEAQAGIALNLGVAAGAVLARLGIFFRYVMEPSHLTLEAFFEVHGEVDVLGLITCSITMHVGLGPSKDAGAHRVDLFGTATITVEIEFAFFSKSVHVQCSRRFAGSDADPVFAELFGDAEWSDYVHAFD